MTPRYTIRLVSNYSGAHAAVYRQHAPGARMQLITQASGSTKADALRTLRRNVRAARKCGAFIESHFTFVSVR